MTTKSVAERIFVVVAQEWEESERGWGCRPDGFTLHLSMDAASAYLREKVEIERKTNPSGVVPEEYTRPSGAPRPVDINSDVYDELVELKKNGTNAMWINNLVEVEPFSKTKARVEHARVQKEAEDAVKLRRENAVKAGLAKLTAEEKEALGLNPSTAKVSRDVNRGWRSV